jgi:hypothetical protein
LFGLLWRVDGIAYWPGPEDFWASVGTTRADALGRYDAVIHLRVPGAENGYGHQNPLRVESPSEARAIDDRILRAWEGHPRRYVIEATSDFITKARKALEILRQELPECCRDHATQALDNPSAPANTDVVARKASEKGHVHAT